ncbi:hypothetical protein AcV5_004514 [Taiwanofungus camphoratus]|nr:hypothetical protein AcW2_000890 [Antrodia cinnamomea]KAI0936351.1 hypothetical protein AcV5_004514 [Antrodia cinnamomea]KAI0961564.1 hypothetical protein AcV7_000635 [Antrodia cinnamomea]
MSSPYTDNNNGHLPALPRTACDSLYALPDDHPLQIALRTYGLALSLSLGPALLPFATSAKARSNGLDRLKRILKREFGVTGFAFAMAVGVGGGTALRRLWGMLDDPKHTASINSRVERNKETLHIIKTRLSSLKDSHKTFVSNMLSAFLAIVLLQGAASKGPTSSMGNTAVPVAPTTAGYPSQGVGRKSSITLDLTLLLLVRAMDAIVQDTLRKVCGGTDVEPRAETTTENNQRRQRWQTRLDALSFWACSARIMWCFFYEPQRLPRSYNKWIMTLANIDARILATLRALRSGAWSYKRHHSTQPDLVSSYARDIGYPAIWGEPTLLPAYGGKVADAAWEILGVPGRKGVGGIPCELVHGSVAGGSCTANVAIRGAQAFAEALALYLPAHFLPILLAHPRSLFHIPRLTTIFLSVLRSASFLSTFVSSVWLGVCLTRTLLLARLFPWVSHDFWDGPYGCTFFGCLACGGSVWIEQGKRRGEIALYVLPRAIRACLPDKWVRSGSSLIRSGERLAFILSLATLLTAATHRPECLRGLSRWTAAFVMKGPSAAFWQRKRQTTVDPSPPTGSNASKSTG